MSSDKERVRKMQIIGENINGAIPKTAEAIRNRDSAFIRNLVQVQESGGADYLDVCAGTSPEEEYETMCWLIDVVQEVATKPLCIDSPDPILLEKLFHRVKSPGIINSVSGEGDKCEILFPILKANPDWQVVALCCDDSGMAAAAEDKIRIAVELIEKAGGYGIAPGRIHIDPLVLALSAVNDSAINFCAALQGIKSKYPDVKITAAVSNVSYGMPYRALPNRCFLAMAIAAGLDSAIMDPSNRELVATIYSMEALLGRDRYCRNYNKAYRAGRIGPVK
jgi:5-methyltetrahydrofolate--homocysteine methyltransferase